MASWGTCVVLTCVVLAGWPIASCTFPEYTFSETEAGLSAPAPCLADVCQKTSCTDKVKNGTETDVDCGGECKACEVGKGCALAADCTEGVCIASTCPPPACDDRVKNASESDVDCGGPTCPKCAADQKCVIPGDCISGDCVKGVPGDNAWLPGDLEPELRDDPDAVVIDDNAYMAQRDGCFLDGCPWDAIAMVDTVEVEKEVGPMAI